MKLSLLKGTTSKSVKVFILDSSSSVGTGLTGLVYNSSSLTAYYIREGANAAVSISLQTMTLGTWATGGFIAVDGTNMPGLYELGIPDAALASGAKSVVIMLKGAANMAPVLLEIELTATDNQTADVTLSTPAKRNTALSNFMFVMLNSSGVPTTSLTVTAQRSINGGAFASCTNSVSELSNGVYKIDLSAADLNGAVICLRFSATGAKDTFLTILTLP